MQGKFLAAATAVQLLVSSTVSAHPGHGGLEGHDHAFGYLNFGVVLAAVGCGIVLYTASRLLWSLWSCG